MIHGIMHLKQTLKGFFFKFGDRVLIGLGFLCLCSVHCILLTRAG